MLYLETPFVHNAGEYSQNIGAKSAIVLDEITQALPKNC